MEPTIIGHARIDDRGPVAAKYGEDKTGGGVRVRGVGGKRGGGGGGGGAGN